MNNFQSQGRPLFAALSLGLSAALFLTPTVGAVSILASLSTSSPVNVGDEFDVSFAVSGWDSGDPEVDAVTFRVAWNPAVFAYVSGSVVSDGSEFLAESNQGAGYSLSDDTNASFASLGVYLFSVSDAGDATSGSIGGADGGGTLGSIRFRALGVGSDTFQTSAPGGDPDGTFADTGLNGIPESSIVGTIGFGGASMEVVPEPSSSVLALVAGAFLMARRRRTRTLA